MYLPKSPSPTNHHPSSVTFRWYRFPSSFLYDSLCSNASFMSTSDIRDKYLDKISLNIPRNASQSVKLMADDNVRE